jgi:hypothetical protein
LERVAIHEGMTRISIMCHCQISVIYTIQHIYILVIFIGIELSRLNRHAGTYRDPPLFTFIYLHEQRGDASENKINAITE